MVDIRQATPDDWRDLKYIRLRALKVDPLSFGSNYDVESKKSNRDWQKQIAQVDCATFLVNDKNTPVGMTAVGIDVHDKTNKTAFLWGSWLEPSLRGQRISTLMYEARIKWIKHCTKMNAVIVACRESNKVSQHIILSNNFHFTHKIQRKWPDGAIEKELFFRLDLGR